MSIENKNTALSLNLLSLSSACSIAAIPASSIHYVAGASVFTLGLACDMVAAKLLFKENRGETISVSKQFATAASATAVGAITMAGAAFLSIRDIVYDTPVSFTSMGAGFALATGILSFYGGLHGFSGLREKAKPEDQTISGP